MKRFIAVMGIWTLLILPGLVQADLYYPHADTTGTWGTEIAVINTGDGSVTGTLRAYSNDGTQVDSMAVNLAAHARREIDVADTFSNPNAIGYLVYETTATDVCGYTKFYVEGTYRVAVPAVQKVNSGDIYVPHIDSSQSWWTGVSIINTTPAAKTLTFQFDNGASRTVDLAAGEHKAFTIASLFNNQSQPSIGSAVITNASGTVGLELFGSGNYLSGVLLKGETTSGIYYPHVVSDMTWWTGIVAYNPAAMQTSITITPYSATGTQLTGQQQTVPAQGKYIGALSALNLPADTAWFGITAASPISGFELFGTKDGNQLAGYMGVGLSMKEGVFAKLEKDGWTGIALVNIEDSAATVTLTAYNDRGAVVVTGVKDVGAYGKVMDLPENLFTEDIRPATYIGFSSNRELVGFQLSGCSGNMMLDALPAMAGTAESGDPNDRDDDSDGYTENQGDCNDNDASINPGGTEVCDTACLDKIDIDLDKLNEEGLYGPPDGLTALDYEFCIPVDEALLDVVKAIDSSLVFYRESPGRIGCQTDQYLCIGNTHQENFRHVLCKLAALSYVNLIQETFWE